MDKISTRQGFGEALNTYAKEHDFYVLDADLSKATQTIKFSKNHPERFYNIGIAEGDMMTTAAGIASCGETVVASTFAMFAAGRAFEQIRNSIAYPNLNVKIAGTHGGILIGEDGGSHQCIEDISLMRTIPNMTVLVPADAQEAKEVVKKALMHSGPVYMRFGRLAVPQIYDKDMDFKIGKGKQLIDGTDGTIIAVGDMVYEALEAAKELKKEGISIRVIDMCSVKPIDKDLIIKAAKETGAIITAEDHNIIGGLGSAVAEILSENFPVPIKRVGVMDVFGRSGKHDDLAKHYGINSENIADNVKKLLK